MYNAHRGMVPPTGTAPSQRLNELVEALRAEVEAESQRGAEYEGQIQRHLQEVDMIRAKVYNLEQQHSNVKKQYEDEMARMQSELNAVRGGHGQPAQQHHPPAQPPPAIGHGPSTLFGGIMAGNAAPGGPALAPPPQEGPPPALPPHVPQGQSQALNPPPGPPQAPPYVGYQPGPNGNGFAPQPTASPSNKRGGGRAPPGPATPQQQNAVVPYPGSPQVRAPANGHSEPGLVNGQALAQRNTLADLDLDDVSPEYKKEGDDWFVVYNPTVRRELDVELVQSLSHTSVVCCVRFSLDGRLVATGCNRSAQIFNVDYGNVVSVLNDTNVPEEGDLYIRSVCFSPNGLFLATGAEDKVIRVWDIHQRTIKHRFTGHEQDIYSLDYARSATMIASGSGDRTVRCWDLTTNAQVHQFSIEDGVTTVAISPDNRYVVAGSLDRSILVWDLHQHGTLIWRLEGEFGHKDSVYSVAFTPTGDRLVSGSLDRTIKMWDLTRPSMPHNTVLSGRCIRTFEGHKDFVLSVALTPHGDWVLSGSKDRGVQFWNPHTGVAQLMLQGHKNSVISVAPSPQGGIFATGSGDLRARIWKYDRYTGP